MTARGKGNSSPRVNDPVPRDLVFVRCMVQGVTNQARTFTEAGEAGDLTVCSDATAGNTGYYLSDLLVGGQFVRHVVTRFGVSAREIGGLSRQRFKVLIEFRNQLGAPQYPRTIGCQTLCAIRFVRFSVDIDISRVLTGHAAGVTWEFRIGGNDRPLGSWSHPDVLPAALVSITVMPISMTIIAVTRIMIVTIRVIPVVPILVDGITDQPTDYQTGQQRDAFITAAVMAITVMPPIVVGTAIAAG